MRAKPLGAGGFTAPRPTGSAPKLLKPRAVACPTCGARIGEPCVTGTGTEASPAHRARLRLATRARQATRKNLETGIDTA